jgi:Mn-dependent DtxR family transcriptional regulator
MARQIRSSRHTPRSEDYLEVVYHLIQEKGYATTSDISSRLSVKPPTVSNMVAKLAEKGYLQHERYRGMRLTPEGERLARSVISRHEVIAEFLSLIGVAEEIAYEDTEGIEHHVQAPTFYRLRKTAEYFRKNPAALAALRSFIESGD